MAAVRCFCCLFLTLWSIGTNNAASVANSGLPNKTINLRESTVIIVIFDGFSSQYVSKLKNVRTESNLTQFFKEGVLAARGIMPQMMTSTFPNHYSIITGLYVESHGIINNHMTDPRPEFLNKTFTMRTTDRKWWEYGQAEPLWITNQNNKKKSAVLFWPGHNVNIRGSFPTYRLKNLPYNMMPYVKNASVELMPWNDRIDQLIRWLSLEDPPNFLAAYFEEPDEVAHRYGPNSEEVLQQILRVDDTIGYMKKRFQEHGLWDRVNIILTADHGMVETKNNCRIYLDEYISNTTYEFISGGVLQVQPKEGFEEVVYQNLTKAIGKGLTAVYKKKDFPEKFHYKNNIRVPEVLGIVEEGCLIFKSLDEELTYNASLHKGRHGYSPDYESMRPFFTAHGPAFKKGHQSDIAFQNIHIYPLICKLLQIKPSTFINGSFEAVEHLLKERPSLFTQLAKLSPILLATIIISILILVVVISFGIFSCISQRVLNNSKYVHRVSMKELQRSEEPLLNDGNSADEMDDSLE